jgi:hypothetical protein
MSTEEIAFFLSVVGMICVTWFMLRELLDDDHYDDDDWF